MALPEHQPRITEVDSFPAQMTPTPSSLLAYGRVDSSQVSSLPGAPASRRARSGGIVVSVLVGAILFLGFANRKRIIELLDTRGESSKEAIPFEVDPALTKKLQAAEADWIRWRLLNKEKNSHKTELARAALLEELRQQNREKSWDAVNLLRAQGKVSEARELAGQLAEGASGALSLTLLDLAESIEAGETPPWPLVLERLKEASSGERGRFFARTVYIYSLFESGQAAKATADFEAFSRLSGAQKSPLFEDLRAYLTANSDDGPKTAEKPEGKRGSPGPGPKAKGKSELPEGSVPSVSASTPEPKGAHLGTSAPEDGSESTPRESTEPGELDEPAPPLVPPATTVKAQRADELWRTGNREKALILYREIVRELGTTGHLGQRAAARIRLAEQAGKETP
jgi:hypothetical protein